MMESMERLAEHRGTPISRRGTNRKSVGGRAVRTSRVGWLLLALWALTLLAGCAGSSQTVLVWVKEGGSEEELHQAIRECEPYAVPSRHPGRSDRMAAESSAGGFVRCMAEKGWTWETREVSQ